MKKFLNYVTGNSTALRLNGESVALSSAHKYNEPLIIYDQYGWTDGCKPKDVRVIFPPFSDYTVVEKGDLYTVGVYTIVSSNTVGIFNYIINNPKVLDELSFYIKIQLLHSNLSDIGWTYHYEFDTKEDQYFNRQTGEVVIGIMNAVKKMDLDRECRNVAIRYNIIDK